LINKNPQRSSGLALAALVLFLLCGETFAGNFINKEIDNPFISKSLKKKFYTMEVQTDSFFDCQQSKVNGLIESYRGTSRYMFDLFTRAFCYGDGGVLDCQSFTYDSAVAATAYAVSGQLRQARKILTAYRKEFYRSKNDFIGLCNSYRTDAVDRDGLRVGVDGLKIHLGPAMWVSVAALHYSALTEDFQYLGFVLDMAKWAQQLKHSEFADGQRGGVSMGYGGWGPDWTKVYSTENNVDYYAVLSMLRDLYLSDNSRVKEIFYKYNYGLSDIESEMRGIERWMKEVAYNPEDKGFNGGFNEKGVQKTRALDTVAWTIASLGPEKLQDMDIDPFDLMDYAERHFLVISDVMGERVEGFDFTDPEGRKSVNRMIWVEGTGIQTVAYQVMSRYAKKMGRNDKAEEYRLKAMKYSDELEKISDTVKLIDNSLPYTSRCLGEKEVLYAYSTEWELPRGSSGQWVASVSSTAWRYYALCGFNPLSFNNERITYRVARSNKENPKAVTE